MKMKKFGAVLLSAMIMGTMISGCSAEKPLDPSGYTLSSYKGDTQNINFLNSDMEIEGTDYKLTLLYTSAELDLYFKNVEIDEAQTNALKAFKITLYYNNKSDKRMKILTGDAYVNGIKVIGKMIEFPADSQGEKKVDLFYYSKYDSDIFAQEDDLPIKSVDSVFLRFNVSENYDIFSFVLYPGGKDKARLHRREKQEKDIVIHSDENVDILAVNSIYKGSGFGTVFYIANKTDDYVTVAAEDQSFSVNVSQKKSEDKIIEIAPGQCTYEPYFWFDSENSGATEQNGFDITCRFKARKQGAEKGEYIVSTEKIKFSW